MRLMKALVVVPAIVLACAANLGAGQQAPAAGTTPKQEKTDIPECDRYFAMVDACVATNKMTADEKKAAQSNVDRLRMMLPIAKAEQGRATLVERCTKSIEAGQKDDKYGCYKTPAKPGGPR